MNSENSENFKKTAAARALRQKTIKRARDNLATQRLREKNFEIQRKKDKENLEKTRIMLLKKNKQKKQIEKLEKIRKTKENMTERSKEVQKQKQKEKQDSLQKQKIEQIRSRNRQIKITKSKNLTKIRQTRIKQLKERTLRKKILDQKTEKIFYICSWGNCGEKDLAEYLSSFGSSRIIYTKRPLNKLTYNTNGAIWFTSKEIPEDELENHVFIFLYRNPVYTLYKPFNRHHLKYIGVPFDTSLKGILTSGQDLLYIDRLFTKFTKSNEKRNYKIHCINFDGLFKNENMKVLNEKLGISDEPTLYPIMKQDERKITEHIERYSFNYREEISKIYKNFLEKIDQMQFLTII